MTSEEQTPTSPPKQKRGCLITFVVVIGLLLGGCLTLVLKRTDIGIYLVRKGIAAQPWTEATRQRANDLLERYLAAHEADRLSEADIEAMKPLVDEFRRLNDPDGIPEEEAGPLLDRWEAWMEEAEKEP